MKALPQPAFVAYSARLHSYGAHIEASRVPKTGRLAIALFIGSSGKNDQAYPGMERASDDLISLLMPDGTHAVSHFAFVNPTWGGAYDTMRYGWEGRPDTPSPADAKGARPAPSPSAIPVIAIEQAIGSGFYRVYDEGPATCESGAQGHRVHLVARSNPSDHPLNDAIIDTRTLEFCSLTFTIRATGIIGATGSMTFNFADHDGYQLISDGRVDFNLRAFGIALKRIGALVQYSDVTIPTSLPDERFRFEKGPAPKPTATPTTTSGA